MVHFHKSSGVVSGWVLSILLLAGSVFNASAQNQNCADVDFSYEVIGNTVRLSGQSTDNILHWYWNFGNGTTVTGQHATVSFEKNGIYEICLKVLAVSPIATTNAGCTGYICKKISIGNISDEDDECGLKADFEFAVSGNDIKLSGKSSDPDASYLWSISGQNVQKTGKEVFFSTDKPGVFEVCVIVVNGAETCKVRVCKKIQIGQNCTLEADFSFETAEGIFKFTARTNQISTSVSGIQYFWELGDGNTSSGPVTKHQYANDGIFNVCLTVRDTRSGCTARVCKTVNSDGNCDLKADFKSIISQNGVSFTGRSNNDNARYYWDFGNSTRAEGQNVRVKYDKAGIYTVCLTVVDEEKGCKVQVCKRVMIGRTFGPTISDTANPKIAIFPNPVIDIVNIQSSTSKIIKFTIFNAQQVPVIQQSANDFLVSLNVSDLPEGIYIVLVVLEDGSTLSARFYKK